MPHLCKQERKRPTPVRRRLAESTLCPDVSFQECAWVPVSGINLRILVVLSNHSAFRIRSTSADLCFSRKRCQCTFQVTGSLEQ